MKMVKLSKELLFFEMKNYNNNIFLASLLSIGITIFFLILKKSTSSTVKVGVPGRLGLPFVGETISFLFAVNSTKGVYNFVTLRRLRYGKWFKTRLLGKVQVFVPTATGAKMIFTNEFMKFNKGYLKSMKNAVGPKSLFCVTHESHKRIRRLLSDPFSMNSLSGFVPKFDKLLCDRLKKLENDGNSFVVLDFNMKITFDAMCDMLMSITDASLLTQIENDCAAVSASIISFPFMIPGTTYYKGIKARERLMETFEEIIGRRRSGKECHEDFLQTMLKRESYPADEKLDDSEIKDNLLTLIIAGQATTAAAMMWSLKFLDENRTVQDKLREESLAILRNKTNGALLTLEDLNNMSYTSKVVKETLRMSNGVLWFPRRALEDCIVDGVEIKKGWNVNIDATCIHYDPTIYKDPLHFNPSRFDEIQKPYTYMPFALGARTCLGIDMAKMTMVVYLQRLTSGYKWKVDDHDPRLGTKTHIPRLRSGLPITLTALENKN